MKTYIFIVTVIDGQYTRIWDHGFRSMSEAADAITWDANYLPLEIEAKESTTDFFYHDTLVYTVQRIEVPA